MFSPLYLADFPFRKFFRYWDTSLPEVASRFNQLSVSTGNVNRFRGLENDFKPAFDDVVNSWRVEGRAAISRESEVEADRQVSAFSGLANKQLLTRRWFVPSCLYASRRHLFFIP